MKEQHLEEAMKITGEIGGLHKAREMVNMGVWTLCKVGQSDDEHQYAAQALGSNEDWIRRVAKEALLTDIQRQIATRRLRLKEIGVELDEPQMAIEDKKAA